MLGRTFQRKKERHVTRQVKWPHNLAGLVVAPTDQRSRLVRDAQYPSPPTEGGGNNQQAPSVLTSSGEGNAKSMRTGSSEVRLTRVNSN